MMSECFICQRKEGVVELPLGPFCVQCIKEIGRHYVSTTQQGLSCWKQRSAYVANSMRAVGRYHVLDEWEKRCSIISICAATRDSRGVSAVVAASKATIEESEDKAIRRIAGDLKRPPKREDVDIWIRRCDRLAKGINRREGQRSTTPK